ncbi:MAG TPA: DUF2269 family protein [Candidatus Limnocylindrales bacterium]
MKAVHALIGLAFLAALIGRWIALAEAARAGTIGDVRAMLSVSARFERIVVVSSVLVLLVGIATAVVQGRPFLGPFQGGHVDWLFVSLILVVSIIPLVPVVFLPRGRAFEAALEEAARAGSVTARLRAAFGDPVVAAAHAYELIAMLVVFVLMVMKPF